MINQKLVFVDLDKRNPAKNKRLPDFKQVAACLIIIVRHINA